MHTMKIPLKLITFSLSARHAQTNTHKQIRIERKAELSLEKESTRALSNIKLTSKADTMHTLRSSSSCLLLSAALDFLCTFQIRSKKRERETREMCSRQ
jgi:hypothetical protein